MLHLLLLFHKLVALMRISFVLYFQNMVITSKSINWLDFLHCLKTKLRGLSPHANYTDRAAAAGQRS